MSRREHIGCLLHGEAHSNRLGADRAIQRRHSRDRARVFALGCGLANVLEKPVEVRSDDQVCRVSRPVGLGSALHSDLAPVAVVACLVALHLVEQEVYVQLGRADASRMDDSVRWPAVEVWQRPVLALVVWKLV